MWTISITKRTGSAPRAVELCKSGGGRLGSSPYIIVRTVSVEIKQHVTKTATRPCSKVMDHPTSRASVHAEKCVTLPLDFKVHVLAKKSFSTRAKVHAYLSVCLVNCKAF